MIFYIIYSLWILHNKNPCINCKFFINNEISPKYGQCSLFPIIYYNSNDDKKYYYCSTIRGNENKCGKEGKYWKKKEKHLFSSYMDDIYD